jgi:DNA-binding winged helix-turn-helix (wHTH) protein/tetratricopeptide (TPR) repeat protein
MPHNQSLRFDLYRLDGPNACLWRGRQMLPLTPKAFAVLHYLLAHAGQLVTKEALFQAVWPDIAVSDVALTIGISEIRKVLGDTAQAPRFIATVHRRGYRFLAPVTAADPSTPAPPPPTPPLLLHSIPPPRLVGREAALLRLRGWLAQRREPARFLLLGTYRPVEAMVQGHPLRAVTQALTLRGQGTELRLELLSEAAVGACLAARFAGYEAPPGLIRLLYQHTDGQPLFLVQVVEAWVQQGWVQEVDGQWTVPVGIEELAATIPENVRQMIEQQFDGLSAAEQRWLEAASVVGVEFSAAAVAAGVEESLEPVEEGCEALARRGQFLRGSDVEAWPDGTLAGRYGFLHALYQQVVYNRLPIGRRLRLHRRIGERLEACYGERAGEQAAVLAMHFASGRDVPRAVRYLQQAAENAAQRHAHHEVVALATKGLELLATLPDTPARTQQELDLHMALGPVLMAIKGHAAAEVEQTYTRALALCQQLGETPQRFPALSGLWRFYQDGGRLATAREVAAQLLSLAQRQHDTTRRMVAHVSLGNTLAWMGAFTAARPHLEQGIALTDPEAQQTLALRYGQAPGVQCLYYAARTLWCLGAPDQGLARSQAACTLARELEHPPSLAAALYFAARLHLLRGEAHAAREQAEATIALATAHTIRQWLAQDGPGVCGRSRAARWKHHRGGPTAAGGHGQTTRAAPRSPPHGYTGGCPLGRRLRRSAPRGGSRRPCLEHAVAAVGAVPSPVRLRGRLRRRRPGAGGGTVGLELPAPPYAT